MKTLLIMVVLLMVGCSTVKYGMSAEKLLLDSTRPPDLYLADGSPCWYSRKLHMGVGNRWFCEVHDER